MTKLQAIRNFMGYVLEDKVVIARDKFTTTNFGMCIGKDKFPRLKLPYTLDFKYDEIDRQFRKNFVNRCPLAQGFSSITLTLLHECGHWATRSILDIVEYNKAVSKVTTQEAYMEIPWEHLATEWAICWLYSPVNRQIAKRFEKDYFGYGKE